MKAETLGNGLLIIRYSLKVAKLFTQSRNLATFVSELFDKDSANREQNKTCFDYAEV